MTERVYWKDLNLLKQRYQSLETLYTARNRDGLFDVYFDHNGIDGSLMAGGNFKGINEAKALMQFLVFFEWPKNWVLSCLPPVSDVSSAEWAIHNWNTDFIGVINGDKAKLIDEEIANCLPTRLSVVGDWPAYFIIDRASRTMGGYSRPVPLCKTDDKRWRLNPRPTSFKKDFFTQKSEPYGRDMVFYDSYTFARQAARELMAKQQFMKWQFFPESGEWEQGRTDSAISNMNELVQKGVKSVSPV